MSRNFLYVSLRVQFLPPVDGGLPAAPNKTCNATAVILPPNTIDTYHPQVINNAHVLLATPVINDTPDLPVSQLPIQQLSA